MVDTVMVNGSLDVTHSTGTGTFSYEVFFSSSSDPAVVYAARPALTVGPAPIPGTGPVPITSQNIAAVVGDAFKGSGLYVGIRVTMSNTGATNLQATSNSPPCRRGTAFRTRSFRQATPVILDPRPQITPDPPAS